MTHFATVVLFEKVPEDIVRETEFMVGKYQETDQWFANDTRWDWYVIGGRWDGELTGVNPTVVEVVCHLCNGTGTRTRESLPEDYQDDDKWLKWKEWSKGCNGCFGTGKTEEYPDQYSDTPDRNSAYMKDMSPEFVPAAYVLPTGEWVEQGRMGWWGITIPDENGFEPLSDDDWEDNWKDMRNRNPDWFGVLLDCHI